MIPPAASHRHLFTYDKHFDSKPPDASDLVTRHICTSAKHETKSQPWYEWGEIEPSIAASGATWRSANCLKSSLSVSVHQATGVSGGNHPPSLGQCYCWLLLFLALHPTAAGGDSYRLPYHGAGASPPVPGSIKTITNQKSHRDTDRKGYRCHCCRYLLVRDSSKNTPRELYRNTT